LKYIGDRTFKNALDIGCSGNSVLLPMKNIDNKFFCDLAHFPLLQYKNQLGMHPLRGSITHIPFKNSYFDLITALDVLEHIKDDKLAFSELNRVLNKNGIIILTVPHKKKYFTDQDIICGHFRRYEYEDIINLLPKSGLREIITFPIYGQLMKVQFLQKIDPKGTERKIYDLRKRYQTNLLFRKLWDVFVLISSSLMKVDACIQPFHKTMDICVILKKK
jgi:ubiquinone/menaquinone biosynthesis C-methylase UbiE